MGALGQCFGSRLQAIGNSLQQAGDRFAAGRLQRVVGPVGGNKCFVNFRSSRLGELTIKRFAVGWIDRPECFFRRRRATACDEMLSR